MWQRPFQGHFVIRRQGLAMFNPHIKFEMSTITCKRNDVATNLPLEVFTRRNFAADFCRQKLKFTGKIAKSRFVLPFGELGVTYTVHWWLVGKCVVDFLLELIELFSPALTVEALWANIGRNCAVWKRVGHFERKFQGEGGRPPTNFGVRKLESLGYHVHGVVCVILLLAVLIQYRRVAQTQTHTHTRSWLSPAQS